MVQCQICGKKLVTPKQLENHIGKEHPVDPVETPVVEPIVEIKEAVQPIMEPEPVKEKIILRLKKKVQVGINGIKYPADSEGDVIEAPDIETAAEILRILREAYGDILER